MSNDPSGWDAVTKRHICEDWLDEQECEKAEITRTYIHQLQERIVELEGEPPLLLPIPDVEAGYWRERIEQEFMATTTVQSHHDVDNRRTMFHFTATVPYGTVKMQYRSSRIVTDRELHYMHFSGSDFDDHLRDTIWQEVYHRISKKMFGGRF